VASGLGRVLALTHLDKLNLILRSSWHTHRAGADTTANEFLIDVALLAYGPGDMFARPPLMPAAVRQVRDGNWRCAPLDHRPVMSRPTRYHYALRQAVVLAGDVDRTFLVS